MVDPKTLLPFSKHSLTEVLTSLDRMSPNSLSL